MAEETKRCVRCKILKLLKCFYSHNMYYKSKKTGLVRHYVYTRSICGSCNNQDKKKLQFKRVLKDHITAY